MRVLAVVLAGALTVISLCAQEAFDHAAAQLELLKGATGDRQSLEQLIARANTFLDRDPGHAQALAWRGSAHFAMAGLEMQKGNAAKGSEWATRGTADMNDAVGRAPDDVAVRILRGTSYIAAVRALPDIPVRSVYLEGARSDFQRAFDIQEPRLASLGNHPRGELLMALGDAYSRQGRVADARRYYRLITSTLAGTVYATRAEKWLRTEETLPAAEAGCVGCHVRGR
jgi:tetratricopeptide (TPR) repeat protein